MPSFKTNKFHEEYYRILNLFAEGKIKKLIITVPPQHGKSEGSTRRLPSYMLGRDPNLKIAIVSYNTPFARKFNRDIQRIIDDKKYNSLYPESKINSKHIISDANYIRNADEFEIIGKQGSLKAVGRGGSLTGNPVDILIIDDLYKDYAEGNSPVILESAWDWYNTVADTRLHNDSQQLIVFTRWSEDDLVGRIEQCEKVIELKSIEDIKDDETWYKINYEAIKETEKTELDDREKKEPLWPEKHNLNKLTKSRKRNPEHFNSLYQGNPKPKEGLMYSRFLVYDKLPEMKIIKNYTDTADTGKDYLCSISYGIGLDNKAYIIDVYYTSEPMEITEPGTAEHLNRNKVVKARIESNNGGRGFARNVSKLVNKTFVEWFYQSKNKEARIYTASAGVQRDILFPDGWWNKYPEFYNDLKRYKKLFSANKRDDAPDALTGVYEDINQLKTNIDTSIGRIF